MIPQVFKFFFCFVVQLLFIHLLQTTSEKRRSNKKHKISEYKIPTTADNYYH